MASSHKYFGLVAFGGSGKLRGHHLAGVLGRDVVVLVERTVGREPVALADVRHMFLAVYEDAVFLDALHAFLDGAVELGFCRHGLGGSTQLVNRQYLRVVVVHLLVQLLHALFQSLVAVPPHVVVGRYVVELYVSPLGLAGGAGYYQKT